MNPEPLTIIALNLETYILLPSGRPRGGPLPHPSALILPPKQGDRGGLLPQPSAFVWGLLFFRLEEPRFFLSEKESLIRDNGISCKTVWMLAYKQNYN